MELWAGCLTGLRSLEQPEAPQGSPLSGMQTFEAGSPSPACRSGEGGF